MCPKSQRCLNKSQFKYSVGCWIQAYPNTFRRNDPVTVGFHDMSFWGSWGHQFWWQVCSQASWSKRLLSRASSKQGASSSVATGADSAPHRHSQSIQLHEENQEKLDVDPAGWQAVFHCPTHSTWAAKLAGLWSTRCKAAFEQPAHESELWATGLSDSASAAASPRRPAEKLFLNASQTHKAASSNSSPSVRWQKSVSAEWPRHVSSNWPGLGAKKHHRTVNDVVVKLMHLCEAKERMA